MDKLVVLKLADGNFEQGFPVILQVGKEGSRPSMENTGRLPAAPDILKNYNQWQSTYRCLELSFRMVKILKFTKVSAIEDCQNAAQNLGNSINTWLNSEEFRSVKERLMQNLVPSDTIRFILQTDNNYLRRLPWHLWDFFETYRKAEVVLSCPKYDQVVVFPNYYKIKKIQVLAILGKSEGININKDQQNLKKIFKANADFLVQPERQALNNKLYEKRWDILFFAGHSDSQGAGETGKIYLNDNDSLTIEELKDSLRRAIERGLKLAIFNSCDGLGLARALEDWHIPQVIVMREPVPDKVAQRFLNYFLEAISRNEPLHLAVREARERLRELEDQFPCASWLPVIFSNPTEVPTILPKSRRPSWHHLGIPLFVGALISIVAITTIVASKFKQQNTCEYLANAVICQRLADVPKVPEGMFNLGGSTTFAPLRASDVITTINQAHPRFGLRYTEPLSLKDSPGSGTGIKMLIEGQLSFSQSSRPVKDEEFERAEKRGFKLEQIPVAIDGIAFYVNPRLIDQGLKGITLQQVRDIYTGKITNWKDIGGPDIPITPFTRELDNAGTVDFLSENILEKQSLGTSVRKIRDTTESIQMITNTRDGVGGISYASASEVINQNSIRILPLAKSANSDFISPCASNACIAINKTSFASGDYPLTRRLFVIIKRDGGLDEKAGIAYTNILLSNEGQKLIENKGFVPIYGK
jgi:ABC-type phosphate transport system substrate-binding protein